MFESGHRGRLFQLAIMRRFQLRRRNIADGLQEPAVIEPIDPFERGVFDFIDMAPRSPMTDHLRFVQPVDRLRQGVVIGIANAADECFDARLGEPIRISDR